MARNAGVERSRQMGAIGGLQPPSTSNSASRAASGDLSSLTTSAAPAHAVDSGARLSVGAQGFASICRPPASDHFTVDERDSGDRAGGLALA